MVLFHKITYWGHKSNTHDNHLFISRVPHSLGPVEKVQSVPDHHKNVEDVIPAQAGIQDFQTLTRYPLSQV